MKINHSTRGAALFAAALACATCAGSAASTRAQTLSVSTGPEYSAGDFGGETTSDLWLSSLSLRLSGAAGAISLSTAYANLSDVNTLVTAGGAGVEVAPDADGDASGFTDLVVGLSRTFIADNPKIPALTLSGSVKLPTASEADGLTTGAVDYGFRAEAMQDLGPAIGFASVGARFRGESDSVDVRDSLLVGAGFQKSFGPKNAAAISYDYRGPSIVGGDAAHEATALYFRKLTERVDLAAYVYTGFTDASPDIGVGFTISRRLWSRR